MRLGQAIELYHRRVWGFTGSRNGITASQDHQLRIVLIGAQPSILIHGGAEGADTECHGAWRERKYESLVEVYPCTAERAIKFRHQPFVHVHAVRPPLVRNAIIAERAEILIATPRQWKETIRSGTWATIRSARKSTTTVLIIWPNGRTEIS